MKRFVTFASLLSLALILTGADLPATRVKSGASSDLLTIDTSNAARIGKYNSSGRSVAMQSKDTYSAATGSFDGGSVNGGQDNACLFGSNTKTVYVVVATLNAFNVISPREDIATLLKRSSANGAMDVTDTAIPHDSTSAAATATASHATSNNQSAGTLVGNIRLEQAFYPDAVSGTSLINGIKDSTDFARIKAFMIATPVVLRGTGEGVCFSNLVLSASRTYMVNWTWTEE